MRVYADWLWYVEDVHKPVVFATEFNTGWTLFLISFVVFTAFALLNVRIALRSTMVLGPVREGDSFQALATKALQFTRQSGARIAWIAIPVLGFIFAISFRSLWLEYLTYVNWAPFGKTDPIFGLDIGFYAFRLPFLKALAGAALTVTIVPAIAISIIYLGGQGIAGASRLSLTVPKALPHLNVVYGLVLLAVGWSIWLGRYDALSSSGVLLTGVGYTDAHIRLPILGLLAWGCWALGAGSILFSTRLTNFRLHIGGLVVLALGYLIGYLIVGGILQSTVVKPNELEKELPYIRNAIAATRQAYNLDRIDVRDYPISAEPSEADIKAGRSTLENMRIWDYRVLREAYDGLQVIRPYYTFNEVDVDRYTIDGRQRMVNIGAREINPQGLGGGLTWQNLRLQYTHGLGVVINPVNSADSEGKPNFLVRDIPPVFPASIPVKESRIYYGEGNLDTVYVRSKLPEFDISEVVGRNLPDDTKPLEETHFSYLGNAGIGINSFSRRFLISTVTGDFSAMTTEAFTSQTKALFHRQITERAGRVLPFLQWDQDPYPVVVDGRVIWIMDGYTTTDAYPYSAPLTFGDRPINYIRNSVKVTIDASTGELNAYVFDTNDPVLKVYHRVYPGLLRPRTEMPASVEAHVRYPEDLFLAQSYQLQLYHVSDPKIWYQKEDRWALPREPLGNGEERAMEPYFVQMQIPDEKTEGFVLMLPFTPIGRPNMSAWLAAHCDPDRYGDLVLYLFPQNSNLLGPRQAGNLFYQNERISQWVTLVGQRGSDVVRGNLLVIPLGKSMLYVEPLYLQAVGSNKIPELKKVALATQGRIAFGDTYEVALKELLGSSPGRTGAPSGGPAPVQSMADVIKEIIRWRDSGRQALSKGDWAAFGESEKRVDEALRKLQNLEK